MRMPMAGEAALSLKDGARRVNRAPAIVASLWLASAAIALPLVLTVRTTIADHLGGSLEAGAAADGVNYDWMQEFSGRASGAATTFTPAVIGFAAVLDNLSAWADNVPRPPLITAAGLTYLVLLTFLAGGIIDRYARDRATREHGFFAACGVHFLRFVRLGAFSGVVYLAIFLWVHPWLFDTVFQRLTQDTTVERTAFLIRLGLYGVFALLLAVVQLLFDYARVRTVVEDRHSMVSAVLAAIRFLSRHGWAAARLYRLNLALIVLVMALYALVAPGAGAVGWTMWAGFAVGQLYLVARVWAKLVTWASETALFQSRLAHAGHVRRSAPPWPDSPAAEALKRGGEAFSL